MASNRKKVLLPHNMGKEGVDLLRRRDDIEVQIYPAGIPGRTAADPVGRGRIALSGTPYKQAEMDAPPAMQVVARIGVGYDAVELPARRTACRVPLMVAGTADFDVRGGMCFDLMMALAKRTPALDAMVRKGNWGDRHAGAADGAVRQDRADRRFWADRDTFCPLLSGLRHERADL